VLFRSGSLTVVEYEAEVVKDIFLMYSEGVSLRSIADNLNNSMIKPKKSGRWSHQSVSKILHNPIYVGYIRWDGIVRGGDHAAIIGQDVFEAINGPIE
jgi:hypothetical protein